MTLFRLPAALLVSVLACGSLSCSMESKSTPTRTGAGEGEAVAFTDVTHQAGLGAFRHENGKNGKKWYPEQMGSGGGFLDYDGDGWLDVLLMGGGLMEPEPGRATQALWLFRNNGDGTFTERTAEAGLRDVDANTIGMSAADYDNDGDTDFYLTNLAGNQLFRNDAGVFTEVGKASGAATEPVWSSSPIFFDADRDGDLDLYVANYVEWSPETDIWCPEVGAPKIYCAPAAYTGVQSRFYRNDGGTFTDETDAAGFSPALGKSLGVAELDFNGDHWPDLAVVNDGEGDLLYANRGDGRFEEIGVRAGFAFSEHGEARAGMGVDAGVVDSTGRVTIFVGNFSQEMVGVYRSLGNGMFVESSARTGIGYPTLLSLTFGLFLFDVDLDTDLDLLIANGHVHPDRHSEKDRITYRQRPQLFLNRGDGIFDEHRPETGPFAERLVGRGAAYADYDRDGDLDVLITENGGPVHLWRNDLPGGHFLRVRLEGRESNRDGIGSRIRAWVGGLMMERRVRTGSSYLSQSETVAAFGLGQAREVDTLEVVWPSGRVERFEGVEGDREVLLVEGAGVLTTVPLPGREAPALARNDE